MKGPTSLRPARFAGDISLTFVMPTTVMVESLTLVRKCQPAQMVCREITPNFSTMVRSHSRRPGNIKNRRGR
jgi:hypothetical protein